MLTNNSLSAGTNVICGVICPVPSHRSASHTTYRNITAEPRLQLKFIYITDYYLHYRQIFLHVICKLHVNKVVRVYVNIVLYLSPFDKIINTVNRYVKDIKQFFLQTSICFSIFGSKKFLSKHV